MDVQALSPEVIQDVPNSKALPIAAQDIAATFGSDSIDLVAASLGSRILSFSDEFFAPASSLTKAGPPIHKPGVYVHTGAWFDGWETRRHNSASFDYVVFRLGVSSGIVNGVEIDTGFFSGNHAPEVSVQGCFSSDDDAVSNPDYKGWQPILGREECGPKMRQAWKIQQEKQEPITHVRLCMFPDGGIARFRLYGIVNPVFPRSLDEVIDLAATINGGVATKCSDQHFGTKDNLLLPGRGVDMGDGWETKRSRGVHVDWVIVRLGAPGEIKRVVVDTAHFRGNFPQKVQLFAAAKLQNGQEPNPDDHDVWVQILAPQPCGPDAEHHYEEKALADVAGKSYAFVKMVIIPDGGVKRLRVFGKRTV